MPRSWCAQLAVSNLMGDVLHGFLDLPIFLLTFASPLEDGAAVHMNHFVYCAVFLNLELFCFRLTDFLADVATSAVKLSDVT